MLDILMISGHPERAMKTWDDSVQSGDWLALLQRHICSVRFGTVQVVIHDSRVVQIETTEKIRLEPTKHATPEQKAH
jgi:hypothetical protein